MKTARCNVGRSLFLPVLFALTCGTTAYGQNNVAGNTALENARIGAVQGRSPGNLVAAGVAHAQAAADFAKAGIEITETSLPMSWETQFLVNAVGIVFEQLNQAITVVANLLVVRAGGTPSIPVDLIPDTSGGDGSDNPRQPPSGRK